MPENKIQILSTRPIDPEQIKRAAANGIQIDCINFIETTPIEKKELPSAIQAVLSKQATVVFTSMNAIEVVASHLADAKPNWSVYCMGVTSKNLIRKHFGDLSIAGTATNSTELAERIIAEKKAGDIYFFCGDQRRDELPSLLKNHGFHLNEIEVYHTHEISHRLEKIYDGILFFSPSAVISFFNSNQLPASTLVFAIGKTTASTLASKTKNSMLVADLPGKDMLVNRMMAHFLEQPSSQ